MLERSNAWSEIMALPSISTLSLSPEREAETSSKKKKKKKKEKPTTEPANHTSEGISGDLCLVAFVSCLADLVHDAGVGGGMSPPATGWMDEYVRALGVLGPDPGKAEAAAPSPRKKPKAPARKKGARGGGKPSPTASSPKGGRNRPERKVWTRHDLRGECAALACRLVEAHDGCLRDAFSPAGEGGRWQLVNDEDHHAAAPALAPPTRKRSSTTAGPGPGASATRSAPRVVSSPPTNSTALSVVSSRSTASSSAIMCSARVAAASVWGIASITSSRVPACKKWWAISPW